MGDHEINDKKTIQNLMRLLGDQEIPSAQAIIAMLDAYSECSFPESVEYTEETYELINGLLEPFLKASGNVIDEETGEPEEYEDAELPDLDSDEWRKTYAATFRRLAQIVLEF